MEPIVDATLRQRAIRGLARFHLSMAVLIFLPAWSLRYWQAWIYVTLFSAATLAITLYFLKHDPPLIARRLQVGARAEQARTQKMIQTVSAVLLCATFVVPGLDHHFHWSSVPSSVVVVADAFVVVGLAIVFRVFRENSYTAGTVQVEANQPVISTGPYAIVRHPMYAGSLLAFLATPPALGSLWGLVPAVALCAAVVIRLLDEERILSLELPGYEGYRRQVRSRLVPLLW